MEPRSFDKVFGQTGVVGRDGLLTPDQWNTLNGIQESAARACVTYLDTMQPGDKFPMVGMATGIGKGNIIHRIITEQKRRKPDSKILVVAGTKTVLVRQTHAALGGYQASAAEQNGISYIESEDDDVLVDDTLDVDLSSVTGETSFMYKLGKYGQQDVDVQVATIQKYGQKTKEKN